MRGSRRENDPCIRNVAALYAVVPWADVRLIPEQLIQESGNIAFQRKRQHAHDRIPEQPGRNMRRKGSVRNTKAFMKKNLESMGRKMFMPARPMSVHMTIPAM